MTELAAGHLETLPSAVAPHSVHVVPETINSARVLSQSQAGFLEEGSARSVASFELGLFSKGI
ncbi:hypothetical protein CBOM_03707 [Ceraceosorus bombacis]|uniref:Uncharacterized protein n=1 Tax=Ceraceosorus bombacis TaxID=401625 RepID=A0A0P1BID8_9BASI|nr:hypothetical protein CBOM_03707 [Ceraceosorus bombacis]